MMPIAHLVKVTLPNYLAGLPIPDSIGGWFRLGSKKLSNIIIIYLIIYMYLFNFIAGAKAH